LPWVMGSESLLTQCFSNLLGNAAKFVAPGVHPHIRIRAELVPGPAFAPLPESTERASPQLLDPFSQGGLNTEIQMNLSSQHVSGEDGSQAPHFVRVWIEDNGIGIPEGVQHRLFGIFQRFNDQYEGTGIGLAIVRKVTERMGGCVGVESEEGKGSRFWVQLRGA
jgi:signal transduction histidine kinase